MCVASQDIRKQSVNNCVAAANIDKRVENSAFGKRRRLHGSGWNVADLAEKREKKTHSVFFGTE